MYQMLKVRRFRLIAFSLASLSLCLLAFALLKSNDSVHRGILVPTTVTRTVNFNSTSQSGSQSDSTDATGVVKIIHQSWKTTDLPPRFLRWSRSFKKCQPDWQYRMWTDADNEKLVSDHFPWFLPTYRKLRMPVQKADVSRLFYMYKYGGMYCDLDCECLRPFGHLFSNVSLAFGAMEGHAIGTSDSRYVEEGQIENSFMYSLPGHPFIMRLIKRVEQNPYGAPESTTGPYLIMSEIRKARSSGESLPAKFKGKQFMKVFHHSYFNPFSWLANRVPACKDKGGFGRSEENACRAAFLNTSYILQYHTQVWLAGKKHLKDD